MATPQRWAAMARRAMGRLLRAAPRNSAALRERGVGFAAAEGSSCSGFEAVMPAGLSATTLLDQEARALLTRLDRVKSFALIEPMVPAAGISPLAQTAIQDY